MSGEIANVGRSDLTGSGSGVGPVFGSVRASATKVGNASSSPPRNGVSPTSGAKAVTAAAMASAISGRAFKLPSRTWLSRLSNSQAKSPITVAPTMRPLPLRVWKALRKVVNAC